MLGTLLIHLGSGCKCTGSRNAFVIPVLPQGLVSQILQNRGPMESHGQLTRVKGFLEVLLMHNLQSPISLASCWSLLHC